MCIQLLSCVFLQDYFDSAIFRYSWNPEGKTFKLLRRELEDVVRIQIKTEPYCNNGGKRHKARAVVDDRKKGKQKNPEGSVICLPDQGELVHERLFDGNVVSCVFTKPREPHGGMTFENQSVKHPDQRKPD